jgi:mono/diheme cytochrome c family protein
MVNVPAKFVALMLLGGALLGCRSAPPRKDPATLNLTAQEERGRRLYVQHCEYCHDPDDPSKRNGPSMVDLYRKPLMPSGIPARDDKVREVILDGRRMMPGYRSALTDQQVADMIAYMKKY